MKLNNAWFCPDCEEVFGIDVDIMFTCPSCTNRFTVPVTTLMRGDKDVEKIDSTGRFIADLNKLFNR